MIRNIRTHDTPSLPYAERKLCASPTCINTFVDSWDESGLCERCILEAELFDREARWERVFPVRAEASPVAQASRR